jgi:membrane-associated phospholipid phosphatase
VKIAKTLMVWWTAAWLLGGCAVNPERGSWRGGVHWPGGQDLGRALASAAKDPQTWAPLVGAALLGAADLDDDLSAWAADQQPLFGGDAQDASDTLRDLATGTYLLTALLAPSESLAGKATGLAVGAGTLLVTRQVTRSLKGLASRERPDGSNDESFPSGHASSSAAAAAFAIGNLSHMQLPGWAEAPLTVGVYGVAGAAAWARVEAEKHHVADALAGYALGHFLASFAQTAFFEDGKLNVGYLPLSGGGALTLRVALATR